MWESWLLVLNFAFVYNTFVQFSISLVRLLFWGCCEISVYLEQKPLWFVFLELRFVRYARFQYQVGFGWRRLLPWAYFETRWPEATSRSSLRQGFTNAKGGSVFRFSGDSHHHHLTARHPKCHLTASPWVASRSGRLPLTPGNYEDPASESMRLGLASFSAATWQLFTPLSCLAVLHLDYLRAPFQVPKTNLCSEAGPRFPAGHRWWNDHLDATHRVWRWPGFFCHPGSFWQFINFWLCLFYLS